MATKGYIKNLKLILLSRDYFLGQTHCHNICGLAINMDTAEIRNKAKNVTGEKMGNILSMNFSSLSFLDKGAALW